jgi:hypothetical protein
LSFFLFEDVIKVVPFLKDFALFALALRPITYPSLPKKSPPSKRSIGLHIHYIRLEGSHLRILINPRNQRVEELPLAMRFSMSLVGSL